ncbi:vWA domain-containing protein [Patulibacter defluvii]|uniref:vWA domain-containing protein n=1 Tax=Patulibacter defluvii TaxID=3095358 RepID=UPI002A750162|nr:VWA domain-containing protein [Patulibacter sp. DM4]
MKKGQLLIVAIAVIAVAAIAILASGGSKGGGTGDRGDGPSAPPAGAITIDFAYSPEKAALIEPLIRRFNGSDTRADGRPVFVRGRSVASGDAQEKIARGRLQPVVWSPASSLWGRLLNFTADRPYVADENPSLVRTPLVIAMWEPMARALGWPKKQLAWADVLKLARAKQGWASIGRPEFGRFKLVHTNPDFSTAGLSSVVAEYYAATGKKEGLRVEDVDGKARSAVRAIEQSIVHYGDTTLFIADHLRREGPAYASAVALEEATLVDFNRHRGRQPKLVALYPKEGTFYSDNPFIVLDAPWVDDRERAAARAFQRYLAQHLDAATAARGGFRPAAPDQQPVAPITAENGVDPAQPKRVLALPEPRVLDLLRRSWREDRKPANIALVVDTSGSMGEEGRMESAKDGLKVFLKQVSPRDRIGLVTFSDTIDEPVPLAEFKRNGARLRQVIEGLVPDGGTAVYDVTAEAFAGVRRVAGGDDRINAVVLLTDGDDTDSRRSADQVVRELSGQGDSATQVRVFTIAYSAGATGAKQALQQFAQAAGGRAYSGDTDDIESVYRSISSFF